MTRFRAVLISTLLSLPLASLAQLSPSLAVPPENYAVLHAFGATGMVDIQHMAYGGAHIADDRFGWHGNPAGMAAVRGSAVEMHHTWAPFSKIPGVHRTAIGGAFVLGSGTMKLLAVWADGAGSMVGPTMTLGASSTERDFVAEYAFRPTPRLAVGLATAYVGTHTHFRHPSLGTVADFSSRPQGPGGRMGAIYRTSTKTTVGATYDNYTERVVVSEPVSHLAPTAVYFHSTGWALGGGWFPDESTTLLVDYSDKVIEGGSRKVTRRGLAIGGERRIGRTSLRLGEFEGRVCGGLGVRLGRWECSYAFSGRADKDLPGMGAGTTHAFQVRSWF